MPLIAIILAGLVTLPVLWFVWFKYQQTRWRHIADELYFEKFEELKAVSFDSLAARVGQPTSVEERKIDGHTFRIGWRVDRRDTVFRTRWNVETVDNDKPVDAKPGQTPFIEEVEIRGYVDFIQLVPFYQDAHWGDSLSFLRTNDGELTTRFPSEGWLREMVVRRLTNFFSLSPSDASNFSDHAPVPEIVAKACADAMEGTSSYFSRARFEDRSIDDWIEWFYGHEKPDRFVVTQTDVKGEDFWLTVGAETYTYRHMGSWKRMPDREDAPEVNQQLAMDWYLEILRTARPVAVRSCQFSELRPWFITMGKSTIEFGGQSVREHEMTLLEYHIETAGQNCLLGALGNGPWHITFWIDGVTNLLERIDAVNGRKRWGARI